MSRAAAALLSFLSLGSAAMAQIPKGDVFFGYSYARSSLSLPVFPPDSGAIVVNGTANLNGWNASLAGKVFPFVKLVTDVSGHYGSQTVSDLCGFVVLPCHPTPDELHVSTYHVLFGPRVYATVGRLTPFAHALFGIGHTSEHTTTLPFSDTSTAFAYALGGGLDYRLAGPLGWRLQGDFLRDRFFVGTQNNFRFSTGVVLRF